MPAKTKWLPLELFLPGGRRKRKDDIMVKLSQQTTQLKRKEFKSITGDKV